MKTEKNMMEGKTDKKQVVVMVRWVGNMQFVATDHMGHSLVMDIPKELGGGGTGFTPVQLLLVALGGCTGIDIINILEKQRQRVVGLEIKVCGERKPDPPRVYSKIHIEYTVKGENLDEKAVKRAIELSEGKYCSVGAMIRKEVELTTSYTLQQVNQGGTHQPEP
ncbi:MAG: hypothetical protein DRO11_02910 [Methanobacteriota archaeon]|nr:MAG: hypothetical protein DRO11_02910 [Euryarchaeota archaeon]